MDAKALADFITNNGIIGVTAGVTIGLVSKELIMSLVQDIVIPIIIILLLRLKMKQITDFFPNKDNGFSLTKFISAIITWILAIICTFIFVQYAFVQLIGANPKVILKKQASMLA
jgi:large-conductance mechanosensitive channel